MGAASGYEAYPRRTTAKAPNSSKTPESEVYFLLFKLKLI
jgi:hypothetical protein